MANREGAISVLEILINLQNARDVWGEQSRQYKEIQKIAEELLKQQLNHQELVKNDVSSGDDLISKLESLALSKS